MFFLNGCNRVLFFFSKNDCLKISYGIVIIQCTILDYECHGININPLDDVIFNRIFIEPEVKSVGEYIGFAANRIDYELIFLHLFSEETDMTNFIFF